MSNQSKYFISAQHVYATLKFAFDIESSGQSYKGSTIVNYDSRVVIWGIFKSGMTLES